MQHDPMIDVLFSKEVFGGVALLLTFVAFYPYYRAILKRETKPHVFSWFIWGVGTVIVFFAQLSDGAGIGAWPIGVSGLMTFGVAILALWKAADTSIVKMDWVFLVLAASALPLWFFTETALSAVIVLTTVDLLGFGPTVRKAYDAPHEENALFFAIGAVRNGFVLLALENMSWTTALFPAAVGLACALFVALILSRRTIRAQ
ncbi:MAG: hypothetical protein AAFZ91_00615 [Pseudomonadota bacterium]